MDIGLRIAISTFKLISKLCGGGKTPHMFTEQSQSAKTAHNAEWTDKREQIVMYLPQATRGRKLFDEYASPELRAHWVASGGKHQNLCPHSTLGCRNTCLGYSGILGIPGGSASRAMLARYVMYCLYPAMFWLIVSHEITKAKRRVSKCGKILVVRINGTSDIVVPEWLLREHPDVEFQDYTKRPLVMSGWRTTVPNYYLIRSATERDGQEMFDNHRGNVVVPVNLKRGAPLPDTFMGRPVIDGDVHDLRCADEQGNYAVLVRVKKRKDGKPMLDNGFIREVV